MRNRQRYLVGFVVSLAFLIIMGNTPAGNELTTVTPTPVVTVSPKPDITMKPDTALKPGSTLMPDKLGTDNDTWDMPKLEFRMDDVPKYKDSPYVIMNSNIPFFVEDEMHCEPYEYYGELDKLGRCTKTWACIGVETMPTSERTAIGHIRPSGWHTIKYDIIDGLYLYNRCHLIGYQLAGENDNVNNLITGTRYLNVIGMLPFENKVADYVEDSNNHVLYRVTPIYDGDDLVATGVLMEAYSLEDKGKGVCFNVFVYNVQPGITIDYKTGKSYLTDAGK